MFKFTLLNNRLGRHILTHDPIGWDSQKYTFKRSSFGGITIDYSQELEFIKDGKEYLQNVYEAEGVEGVVEVIVQEMNMNERWETVYLGVISFGKYEVSETSIKANIDQTGFTRRFINSDDIEIDLESHVSPLGENLTGFNNETRSITLHSKEIVKRFEAGISPDAPTTAEYRVFQDDPNGANARDSTISIGWDKIDINELNAYTYGTGFSPDGLVNEIFPTATESGPIRIEINFKAFVEMKLNHGDFDRAELWFYFRVNDNAPTVIMYDKREGDFGSYSKNVQFSFIRNLNLNVGDKLYFYGRILGSDVANNYDWTNKITIDKQFSNIKIVAYTQTDPTDCRGKLVYETAARLVEAMTGQADSFRSNFFGRTDSEPNVYPTDGAGSMLFLANGYSIRNFPQGEKPTTITFKKFYDSLNAIFNLGAGIEIVDNKEVVRIEPRDYFYSQDVVLELGKVSKLKKNFAAELVYNQAEFGYSKWETGSQNGLDEFNSKRGYALPITQIKKKYAAISNIIAGGYSIETIRREQYTQAASKDNSNDSEMFVICVLRNGNSFVTERNQLFPILDNVHSPSTVYNARLSPARMLRNHGNILKAGLLHQLEQYVRFTNGAGNSEMASRMLNEANVLIENQNFLIAELPDPYYLPEFYEFEYALKAHEIRLIKKNPYGLVKFRDSFDNVKLGYIQEIKASTMSASEFKLLRRFE